MADTSESEVLKGDVTPEDDAFFTLLVATSADLARHGGAGLVEWGQVQCFRVARATRLEDLKRALCKKKLVADWKKALLWLCETREGGATRPQELLCGGDDSAEVGEACSKGKRGDIEVVYIFAEDLKSSMFFQRITCMEGGSDSDCSSTGADHFANVGDTFRPPTTLVIMKQYFPERPRLEFAGIVHVSRGLPCRELMPVVRRSVERRKGLAFDEGDADEVELFVEVSPSQLRPLAADSKSPSSERDVSMSEIVVFVAQRCRDDNRRTSTDFSVLRSYNHALPLGGRQMRHPASYFAYMRQSQTIEFRPRDFGHQNPEEKGRIFLELMDFDFRLDAYDARAVLAAALGQSVRAEDLRLFSVDTRRYGNKDDVVTPHGAGNYAKLGQYSVLCYSDDRKDNRCASRSKSSEVVAAVAEAYREREAAVVELVKVKVELESKKRDIEALRSELVEVESLLSKRNAALRSVVQDFMQIVSEYAPRLLDWSRAERFGKNTAPG